MTDRDRRWTTRIEDSSRRALVVVAPLRDDGLPFPLQPRTPLTVGWPTDTGFFVAVCTLRGLGEDVVATWILDVARIERQQRRSAYRLPLSAPLTLRSGTGEIEGRTCDVSEGGLRCIQPRRSAPELGDAIHLEVALPDEEPIVARAKVVRAREVSVTEVDLGLAFVVIDAEDGERLRRFIFEEQLRRRSAGTT